jgi:hypothetical protein
MADVAKRKLDHPPRRDDRDWQQPQRPVAFLAKERLLPEIEAIRYGARPIDIALALRGEPAPKSPRSRPQAGDGS